MKKVFLSIYGYIRQTDKLLLFLTLVTTGYGILVLAGVLNTFADSNRGMYVQLAGACFGLVCAVILSKFDYHTLGRLWTLMGL